MSDADIYLDHAATTPVDPRVVDVMLPFFMERFGNPSSSYARGRDARTALDWARSTMSEQIGSEPGEVIFTSGATESNNLAIKGVAWWHRFNAPERGNHIIVSAIEHHAVLHAAEALLPHDFQLSVVQPEPDGIVRPNAVEAVIRPDTCLISTMLANNEIGTIQPVREIAAIAHEHGIVMHTDAVQAAGSLPIAVTDLDVDLLSISAHKFYGPKGVGMLYAKRRTPIAWQQHGGGQEDTRRGGTENVALIVGMAAALMLAHAEVAERNAHVRQLRDRLVDGILQCVPDARLNGHPQQRLPNNANICFPGVEGETLLLSLDMLGIAASSGSACSTGSMEPSHVLTAIGLAPDIAGGSLRLTTGKDNTIEQIDRAIDAVVETVSRARELSGSLS